MTLCASKVGNNYKTVNTSHGWLPACLSHSQMKIIKHNRGNSRCHKLPTAARLHLLSTGANLINELVASASFIYKHVFDSGIGKADSNIIWLRFRFVGK